MSLWPAGWLKQSWMMFSYQNQKSAEAPHMWRELAELPACWAAQTWQRSAPLLPLDAWKRSTSPAELASRAGLSQQALLADVLGLFLMPGTGRMAIMLK